MALLARKAFVSFLRAYSVFPQQWKSVLHTSNLHLGHLAKAFALRESPKEITNGLAQVKANTSSLSAEDKKARSDAKKAKRREKLGKGKRPKRVTMTKR